MDGLQIDSFGRRTLQRRRRLARLLADDPAPSLVRAYDLDPGGHLVTEYVPRVTLEDLLSLAPLPPAAAIDALRDVAGELRVMAAETGEAHGDVKPWNVFVLPDGRATIVDPHGTLEEPTIAGATRRGDAYWFAVLACELLTGTRPIDRQDAAGLMERAGLPAAARAAVLRGLACHPQQRPLPHNLAAALAAVPDWQWRGGRREQPAPVPPVPLEAAAMPVLPVDHEPVVATVEQEQAARPVEAVVEPAPAVDAGVTVVEPPSAPRRSLLRRLGPYVAALGVALVLGGAGGGAWLLQTDAQARDPGPATARAEQASLRVTPPTTTCPLARVHLSTTILTDGDAGDVVVAWRLPGGTWLPERTVSLAEGQRAVTATLDVTLTGSQRLRGQAVVVVRPGGARADTPFVFACAPTGGRGATGGHNG